MRRHVGSESPCGRGETPKLFEQTDRSIRRSPAGAKPTKFFRAKKSIVARRHVCLPFGQTDAASALTLAPYARIGNQPCRVEVFREFELERVIHDQMFTCALHAGLSFKPATNSALMHRARHSRTSDLFSIWTMVKSALSLNPAPTRAF